MGHLVQTPCRSRVTYSRLHRTLSRRVLNISREGDSTTSLGSLFQGSVYLRGKKFFRDDVRETTLQTPRSVKEGEEVLKTLEHRFPCSPWRRPWKAVLLAAHGGPQWSRYPPDTCGRPHARAGGCPKESVTPWEARSWQDLWTHGERGAHTGAGLLAGLVTPWGTHTGAACC